MNIPQNQFLSNQSFNSEYIEFVWRFPKTHTQIIFKISKDGSVYLQEGVIDDGGEYLYDLTDSELLSPKNVFYKEFSKLKDDVVKYLNES